jgi:hypothetical protein
MALVRLPLGPVRWFSYQRSPREPSMQDYDVAPLASAQVRGLAWSALPDAPVRIGFERLGGRVARLRVAAARALFGLAARPDQRAAAWPARQAPAC